MEILVNSHFLTQIFSRSPNNYSIEAVTIVCLIQSLFLQEDPDVKLFYVIASLSFVATVIPLVVYKMLNAVSLKFFLILAAVFASLSWVLPLLGWVSSTTNKIDAWNTFQGSKWMLNKFLDQERRDLNASIKDLQ